MLYLSGRSPKVPDSIADKFEELAAKQNLGLDYVFKFPDYSKSHHLVQLNIYLCGVRTNFAHIVHFQASVRPLTKIMCWVSPKDVLIPIFM